MSDILIKNMKMPENCVGCPLAKNYGMCAITKKTFNWGNPNRLSDCPLIEILPHGRLIDTDSTVEVELYDDEHEEWKTKIMSVETYLGYCYNEVPTIIEGDGKE